MQLEITTQDPRKKHGIQFILVTTEQDVVEEYNSVDDIPAYKYGEQTIETDIVDVITFIQINGWYRLVAMLGKDSRWRFL